MKGVVNDRFDGFLHVALSGKAFADPVPKRARLGRPTANIVERDGTQKGFIRASDQEKRQGAARADRALGPIDPVGKRAPRQVIMCPGGFPRGQELFA